MRVWQKYELAQIHIPRTGGGSVTRFLVNQLGPLRGRAHHSLLQNKSLINNNFNIFTMVRDPIDRAMSYYAWFRTMHPNKGYRKLAKLDFSDWLREWFLPKCREQSLFFAQNDIEYSVFFLKFEGYLKELSNYFRSIGLDDLGQQLSSEIPHKHRSRKVHKSRIIITGDDAKKIIDKEHILFQLGLYKEDSVLRKNNIK